MNKKIILKKPIIFLHIPKTGGMTFEQILKDIANKHNLFFNRNNMKGVVPQFS